MPFCAAIKYFRVRTGLFEKIFIESCIMPEGFQILIGSDRGKIEIEQEDWGGGALNFGV